VWDPVSFDVAPTKLVHGLIERLLDAIEEMPWLPSLWIREVLSEGGLLRARVLRHLPREKMHIMGKAIKRKQREGELNPAVDPELAVFSVLGLVMVHSATTRLLTDAFHRKAPSRDALLRHVSGLLLDGLRHVPKRCGPSPPF